MFKFAKTLMMVGGLGLGLLAANAPANADIIPTNASLPTPVMGGFLWEFNAELTINQFMMPGDFFTIYDFAGFVPMSNIEPANWVFSSTNLGVTPGGLGVVDSASLPNLTWTYTGPTTSNGPTNLGLFKAISTFSNPGAGNYGATARLHSPLFQDVHGDPTMNKGPIAVPVVPEPGTMALLGLGAAPLIGRLRRRTRKA